MPRQAERELWRQVARGLTSEAASAAVGVDGAAGYPFLLQLVGAQTWRLHPDEEEITANDAAEGVIRARRRLGSLIHERH